MGEFDVDTVFSVPIEVCKAIAGFSYDETYEFNDPCFALFTKHW